MLGRTLSHYEVKQELSRGGMGVVYRALDTKLDREVALKVLPPELVADEARRRRFVQEAKAAAAIHHPHIATIHEIGGEPVRITEDAHLDFGPVWTPDGKSLLLSPTVAAAETAIESPSTLHAGPPASPSVSRPTQRPFGAAIGTSLQSRPMGVRLGSSRTTPRRSAIPTGLQTARRSFSNRLAVIAWESMSCREIVGSSRARQRSASPWERRRWSPDGRLIAYTSGRGVGAISVIPPEGGEPELLVHYDDPTRVPLRPEWSADGENFYFTLTEFESDVWVMELESSSE